MPEIEKFVAETALVIEGAEELKSLEVKDGKARVGAYAIRFSDKSEKDLSGEYFTKSTDFGPRNGDGVVAMFNHGIPIVKNLEGKPLIKAVDVMKSVAEMTFGAVKATKDDVGIFVETNLDMANAYEKAIADLCAQGKLKWSTGSSPHIVRKSENGEITRWHPIEFSFTPKPLEPRLPAIAPLKSLEVDNKTGAELAKAFTKSELSLEDLRDQVRTAAQDDSRFNSDAGDCCMGVWVADLISDNNSWTAIIQATDGKYYEVGVSISANKITLATQAKEVVRKTEYAPVQKSVSASRVDIVNEPEPQKTLMTDAEKAAQKAEQDKAIKASSDTRVAEINEIFALGAQFKQEDAAKTFVGEGKSLEDFRKHVLVEVGKAKPVVTNPLVGMDRKEVKSYSVLKALRELAHGGPLTGLEKEASEATAKAIGKTPKGFFIPHDVASTSIVEAHDLGLEAVKSLTSALKNLNQTTFSAGGALVGTHLLTGSLIELLRNKPLVSQMGARGLSGLVGNIAIPAQTGGATAYWLSESGSVTATDQTFQQLGLTPKRLVGRTGYTKELMNQTDLSVEAFVRDDITTVLAIAKDLAAINGSGGSQPLGILNLSGRSTDVTFSGAATRAKAIEFQKNVAANNASRGALAYLTTPAVAAKWMNIPETTYSTKFVWDGNVDSGMVVARRAEATNQVPSDLVIYGNFNDLILADWAGIDVVVNPYTNDATGVVTITITLWTDSGVRHAVSFCVSTDTGAT